MVAACPSCEARYRVDVSRLPADGARLRCSRCENVFRVRPPAAVATNPAPASVSVAPPEPPSPAAPAKAPAGPEAAPPPGDRERERLVLVAHPEVEEAKAIGDALSSWGLDVRLAHDGVEAILGIQRSLPRLVVLDAALPKMFGFQVCELVKRNESLRDITVVLVGAIHNDDRYRRPPSELYGADAYMERPQIPEGLIPIMRELGLDRRRDTEPAAERPSARPAVAPPAPPPTRAVPRVTAPVPPVVQPAPQTPAAPAPATAPAAPAPAERATAERLARIIVSDIVLYNAERFEAAVRQGEVVRAMAAELREGNELLTQRVGASVDVAGLLENEILRVARARGMA